MRGTIVLATRDHEYPSWIKVHALTITGEYIPGKGTPAREVLFTYDTASGKIVEEVHSTNTVGEKVFFQTELDNAHNIYLSKDAIVGTAKKNEEKIPEGELDWKQEGNFDATLNAPSGTNNEPAHASILDVVYAALQGKATH